LAPARQWSLATNKQKGGVYDFVQQVKDNAHSLFFFVHLPVVLLDDVGSPLSEHVDGVG